jgi:CheY-like chemotaxis protein
MARILVVEDNEMNRDALTRRLARRGYEVSVAVDGRQAIDLTLAEKPDLVLMDLSLPEVDGREAICQIRADARGAGIPIIVLTAHAMDGDRESAIAAGADDYDSKPVEMERLLGKMQGLLDTRRGSGA